MLLGNDIAGGAVIPVPQVITQPQTLTCVNPPPGISPSCVVTRAGAVKSGDDLMNVSSLFEEADFSSPLHELSEESSSVETEVQDIKDSPTKRVVSRSTLRLEQKNDKTLSKCFEAVANTDDTSSGYYVENDLLMRRWVNPKQLTSPSVSVNQIVIPECYRHQVLALAHESRWSGHFGIRKTYQALLDHFFWPGMKKDVARFCMTCHTCQMVGKPNQPLKPIPLTPIPVIGNPFDHIIVDCVGPLPRTKSGKKYLLTIMCTASRFPEAIPLASITTKSVIRALTNFFSLFGLPRVLQTDQGSNFKSELFKKVTQTLGIQHVMSSAYHPESQGALERWHQTLKSMLRKYCYSSKEQWDEGLPFLLFASREASQESLGFSPSQLVFGHSPRGPLQALKENFLQTESAKKVNVNKYVKSFRSRLHLANEVARKHLQEAQVNMKAHFDKKASLREFQPGDQVLMLKPVTGDSLSVRFDGPFVVSGKVSENTYKINTPGRKHSVRVCHGNLLKPYLSPTQEVSGELPVCAAVSPLAIEPQEELRQSSIGVVSPRLKNSQALLTLDDKLSHLPPEQRGDILALINANLDLFSDTPTVTNVCQHEITLLTNTPIKQHPYRASPEKRALMKQETDYLLQNELAVPSYSPWSSPCLIEKKPDGSPRLITDYRKINAVTVADSYPLPRIDDCIDRVGMSSFVTKIDLLKGYWQVPLSKRASDVSAFVTPDEFLQYNVMPFGMKNAPATFQRLINMITSNLVNCSAYLDDIVVHAASWTEHVTTLTELFNCLKAARLTINLSKCEFVKATISYLGKEVGHGRVCMLKDKTQAIMDFPDPRNRRELRRFLGMVGYYRCFCQNFASVVAPLTDLLSTKVPFMWSKEAQHAFTSCKSLLTSAPILKAPDLSKPFSLEVDASQVGAGAVLLQADDDLIDHPVAYFSKKFSSCQSRYSTIEKETLALIMALRHFHVYVGSSAKLLRVYTDHNPLTFLDRMFNQNHRLMRWALLLQEFNLEINHKVGAENVIADCLSRS
uniref:Gypsy retrotransposon integrase-like protein 1 n=1 Tax=Nothobranchius furzeri TaxID=105023 RepID=A0A1A8VFT9_NOTFU